MSARSHVCLLGVYDLLFWSAVCLRCSADKCTYIICNQFIEQQFRGKLLAPAWGGGGLSILAHGDLNGPSMLQLSHGAASCDTEGLKQTFGESLEGMAVGGKCKWPSHAGENPSVCDRRQTCFHFRTKVTRHARRSSAHDLIPPQISPSPL